MKTQEDPLRYLSESEEAYLAQIGEGDIGKAIKRIVMSVDKNLLLTCDQCYVVDTFMVNYVFSGQVDNPITVKSLYLHYLGFAGSAETISKPSFVRVLRSRGAKVELIKNKLYAITAKSTWES